MNLTSNRLLAGILIGAVLGIFLGGAFPRFGVEIEFLGDLFLHALMLMVVPLVMASMITGVAGLGDVRKLGAIGTRTIAYYMLTTALSVIVGLVLVNIIQPGAGGDPGEHLPRARWRIEAKSLILDDGAQFNKLVFDDRFEVALGVGDDPEQAPLAIGRIDGPIDIEPNRLDVSEWVDQDGRPTTPPHFGSGVSVRLKVADRVKNRQDRSISSILRDQVLKLVPTNLFRAMVDTDVLPIIVFSLIFGAVLTTMGDAGGTVLSLIRVINDAIMKMIQMIMLFAPVGILALIAGRLGEAGGWVGFLPILKQLGRYVMTVMIGLAAHGFVVLPLILLIIGRRNPLAYLGSLATAMTTAFSTASSLAAMPVTLRSVEKAGGIDQRTASFVIPLGATINMDGTALYEAVAAMFIAQIYGIDLGLTHQAIIFLTATLAAIGAAGIPGAGLVTMIIVLRAVELPIEGITLLLSIDWFLDRCRTAINIWGDAIGAAVIDRYERIDLGPAQEAH